MSVDDKTRLTNTCTMHTAYKVVSTDVYESVGSESLSSKLTMDNTTNDATKKTAYKGSKVGRWIPLPDSLLASK